MHIASVTEPSSTKWLLPMKQDKSAVKMKLWNCTQANFFGQCFFTGHSPAQELISECTAIWKFAKEPWCSLSSSGAVAVNVPGGCWWGRCSDVTLQDVWRKDVWGTTDITWHHPTSQLVSDFSEGCENILYKVKVNGRLQWRKKLYSPRENESIASSYIVLKFMACPLLFLLWCFFV